MVLHTSVGYCVISANLLLESCSSFIACILLTVGFHKPLFNISEMALLVGAQHWMDKPCRIHYDKLRPSRVSLLSEQLPCIILMFQTPMLVRCLGVKRAISYTTSPRLSFTVSLSHYVLCFFFSISRLNYKCREPIFLWNATPHAHLLWIAGSSRLSRCVTRPANIQSMQPKQARNLRITWRDNQLQTKYGFLPETYGSQREAENCHTNSPAYSKTSIE